MKLYTIPEASTKTRMSNAWIRKKIYQREIRYLKIGRRVFIPESTIDKILKESVVEPRNNS
jgi:excisionase family DNA binding protein